MKAVLFIKGQLFRDGIDENLAERRQVLHHPIHQPAPQSLPLKARIDRHVGQVSDRGQIADGVRGSDQLVADKPPIAKLAVLVNAPQGVRIALAQSGCLQQFAQSLPVDGAAVQIGDNFHRFPLTNKIEIGGIVPNGALIAADVGI